MSELRYAAEGPLASAHTSGISAHCRRGVARTPAQPSGTSPQECRQLPAAGSITVTDAMDEIVKEFLIETREGLDEVDRDLVALEKSPDDLSILQRIFRNVHTVKGSAGFLALPRLQALSHGGEGILSDLRDGTLAVSADIISGLLRLVDGIRALLVGVEADGKESELDVEQLIVELKELRRGVNGRVTRPPAPDPNPAPDRSDSEARVHAPARPAAVPGDAAPRHAVRAPDPAPPASSLEVKAGPTLTENSIRVDTAVLDRLLNLVGELVLARNQLIASGIDDVAAHHLNLVTSELQDAVMKTRLQPIGNLWSKFPRLIRDLGVSCGKRVRLERHGADTELDRSLIDAIRDPLTHLLRNAVDHGIENPEARLRAGKNPEGTIRLDARHEGGLVRVEIRDDGAGMDALAIGQAALSRGLVNAERLASMSVGEILELTFAPGFSMAAEITDVSGRGVGMDVVRNHLERVGGAVEIDSELGRGTTVRLDVPLTLAIVSALLVEVAEQVFAIPQTNVLEVVEVLAEDRSDVLEELRGATFFRLRNELLPLVDAGGLLWPARELEERPADEEERVERIVVLESGRHRFGLSVDSVHDPQEIVVKPLGRQVRALPVFSGATLLGDGRLALILDIAGVAQLARVHGDAGRRSEEDLNEAQPELQHTRTLLVFRAGGSRMAIELDEVSRLEEFDRANVEISGHVPVLQYDGTILHLLDLSDLLQERRAVPRDETIAQEVASDRVIQVIVHRGARHAIGLVVEEIEDILEHTVDVEDAGGRRGVHSRIVLDKRVTEILDLPLLLKAAESNLERLREDGRSS